MDREHVSQKFRHRNASSINTTFALAITGSVKQNRIFFVGGIPQRDTVYLR